MSNLPEFEPDELMPETQRGDVDNKMRHQEANQEDIPEYTVVGIEFQKAKSLPSADSNSTNSPFVKEEFLDKDTRWEPKLDHADKLDCGLAVACGVITGIVDSFFVGKFSLERASEWGTKRIDEFVVAMANLAGYDGNDLARAIAHLEKKFGFAADGNAAAFGGGRQHHFRDFSHHFSLSGLLFSIFTQFTGKTIGAGPEGNLLIVSIPDSHVQYLGGSVKEKIITGTVNWLFHMASDMGGSRKTPGKGTGVPGPVLSLIKELSVLPFFKNARSAVLREKEDALNFRELISKLFNGSILGRRDENGNIVEPMRFDFRMELGAIHELGRQSVPVVLNQCFIRSFYFARRFAHELKALKIKKLSELTRIDPEDILPFRNRAIVRMSTISTGIFTVVDASDALVRAAIASKGNKEAFFGEFIVRINFIGVGTFAIACVLDIRESFKEHHGEEDAVEAYERELAELHCLELGPEQIRLLQSLQRLIIMHDIDLTKKARKKRHKERWFEEWESSIAKGLLGSGILPKDYLLDEEDFFTEFDALAKKDSSQPWPYLLALEADLMAPYPPMGNDLDKKAKGLKFEDDYMLSVFCDSQNTISAGDIKSLRKGMKHAEGEIDARLAKNIAKFVGTAMFATAATVLAFVFAPYIAPVIAGEAVAGLSGAALTSASLAFVGGGALAAGGLGMAGGTAIIAGGGAILGTLGGTGITQLITTMKNADGLVFLEASKLLCYCDEVLLKRYSDVDSVRKIRVSLNERILEFEIKLESLKNKGGVVIGPEEDKPLKDKELSRKQQVKVLSKSLKYLKRCNERLAKKILASYET